jgi:hypothetical protein
MMKSFNGKHRKLSMNFKNSKPFSLHELKGKLFHSLFHTFQRFTVNKFVSRFPSSSHIFRLFAWKQGKSLISFSFDLNVDFVKKSEENPVKQTKFFVERLNSFSQVFLRPPRRFMNQTKSFSSTVTKTLNPKAHLKNPKTNWKAKSPAVISPSQEWSE